MKKYIKPNIENVIIENNIGIMNASKEPEVTENIGAKENNTFFDWDDDVFADLWAENDENNNLFSSLWD